MIARAALTAAVASVAALIVCASGSAYGGPWQQQPERIATPFLHVEAPSGHIRIAGILTRYGDSMLGYGMLQTGVAAGDQPLISGALRAIHADLRTRWRDYSVFETMALASAYNYARAHLRGDPRFRSLAPAWRSRLRRVRAHWMHACPSLWNKCAVEALADLELLRTGLRSSLRGTVLGDRAAALRLILRVVNRQIPARSPAARPYLLSDAVGFPLAYGALMSAVYARTVEELGRRASGAARAMVRKAMTAEWQLAGPDGDVAYFGRSQEQCWTLAMAAAGAETAAKLLPGDRTLAVRMHALTERTLGRLVSAYIDRPGPLGLPLVPTVPDDPLAAGQGLDAYTVEQDSAGLTLAALNWALQHYHAPAAGGQIAADRPGGAILHQGLATFATVRGVDVWYAVKAYRTPPPGRWDLRYDQGLVALKVRTPQGWIDTMPVRPHAGQPDTIGPVLLGPGGGPARGGRIAVQSGVVSVQGRLGARPATFAYSPLPAGVQISFDARAGERLRFTAFFRGGSAPARNGQSMVGPEMAVTPSVPFSAAVVPRRYVTVAQYDRALLTRVDLTLSVSSAQTVTIAMTQPPPSASKH